MPNVLLIGHVMQLAIIAGALVWDTPAAYFAAMLSYGIAYLNEGGVVPKRFDQSARFACIAAHVAAVAFLALGVL